MWFSGFSLLILSVIVEVYDMMKMTGLSHLFKWENVHNWWLTKYFFAPLYTVSYTILQYLIHLIMQTYLALLILYTVSYTILLYLSPFCSDIAHPNVYILNSFLLRFVCVGYMLGNLLDIIALSVSRLPPLPLSGAWGRQTTRLYTHLAPSLHAAALIGLTWTPSRGWLPLYICLFLGGVPCVRMNCCYVFLFHVRHLLNLPYPYLPVPATYLLRRSIPNR